MLSLLFFFTAIYDPERIIDRMYNSVEESLSMFRSYANSQRLIQDHEELIHIERPLEHIANKLYAIKQDATH